MNTRIQEIAEQAKLNVPSGLTVEQWIQTYNEKLATLIIEECVACCGSQADMRNIRRRFGLPVESNIKYPSPEAQGHHSQYGRELNLKQ